MDTQPSPGSVEDIFHEFLSGASVRKGAPFADPQARLIKETRVAKRTFQQAAFGLRPSRVRMTTGGVWAFSATQNQAEAVSPVATAMNVSGASRLDHAVILNPMAQWGSRLARAAWRRLPEAAAQLSDLDTEALALVADLPGLLAITMGEADCFRRLAKHKQPGALLITNDHSPRNRAILAAARQISLSTAYLQHAAVGGIERPLDMDLALLQGRHSLDIYRSIGPVEARVELIGSPKVDVMRRARKAQVEQTKDRGQFVIFPGLFDDPNRVEKISRQLRAGFPAARISVRRHPRDDRAEWGDWPADVAVLTTQGEQSAMDALISCDLAVFDDSNVGLEAAALGVPVLCASFKDRPSDQYSLAATGVFDTCRTDGTDLVKKANASLSGRVRPKTDVLDYIFEGLRSDVIEADRNVAYHLNGLIARFT